MAAGPASVTTPAEFAAWAQMRAPGLTFAGRDPHYAIGLEPLLRSYRVISVEDAPALEVLASRGVQTFVLRTRSSEPAARTTQSLLENDSIVQFLDTRPDTQLLVFKTSYAIELLCRRHGWGLLAAPAGLARRWENKVMFRQMAAAHGWPQPPGLVVELAKADYAGLAGRLGEHFVLQAAHGYGGARTYDVQNRADFDAAQRALRVPEVRATAFIQGRPLTLNACVTARGVAASLPFSQATGMPCLTRYRLGSCGNDWSAAPLHEVDPVPFVALADRVGTALGEAGFKGIFGLDFVLGEDGTTYLIEVNPRLVASIALYTQLELVEGRLPLLARHILAHLDPDADRAPLDLHQAAVTGAQLILHNVNNRAIRVKGRPMTGVYRWSREEGGLKFLRPAVRADELVADDELLVLMPAHGRVVESGSAYARIQVLGPVLDGHGGLRRTLDGVVEAVEGLLAEPGSAPG